MRIEKREARGERCGAMMRRGWGREPYLHLSTAGKLVISHSLSLTATLSPATQTMRSSRDTRTENTSRFFLPRWIE
jgi:hypothetical protein